MLTSGHRKIIEKPFPRVQHGRICLAKALGCPNFGSTAAQEQSRASRNRLGRVPGAPGNAPGRSPERPRACRERPRTVLGAPRDAPKTPQNSPRTARTSPRGISRLHRFLGGCPRASRRSIYQSFSSDFTNKKGLHSVPADCASDMNDQQTRLAHLPFFA